MCIALCRDRPAADVDAGGPRGPPAHLLERQLPQPQLGGVPDAGSGGGVRGEMREPLIGIPYTCYG